MKNNHPVDAVFQAIKLLVVIVERGQAEAATKAMFGHSPAMKVVLLGQGTARSEILDYLGIGEVEKDVILSLVPIYRIPALLKRLDDKMHLAEPGNGIAFTLPVISIGKKTAIKILESQPITLKESEVICMQELGRFGMIVTVVTRGFTDQVMDAATSAGATGGTVIRGRSLSSAETEEFMGLSIHPEKDIVIILAPRENKQEIMRAISHETGPEEKGHSLSFAVPVGFIAGIPGYPLEIKEEKE